MIQELEYARGVEQISHPEIAQIEKPLIDLSRQVLLDGTHYDLIIGDDTSGRLPTLILGRVLRDIYESVGEQTSQVRFVRGRNENRAETQQEVDDVLVRLGKKPAVALVVTELVDSGRCLRSITGALQNREVDHNVAALFIFANPKLYIRTKSIQKGSRLFYHKQTNKHVP